MIYKISSYQDDNIELHISKDGLVDIEIVGDLNVNGKPKPIENVFIQLNNSFDVMAYIIDTLNDMNEECEESCNDDEDADDGDTLAANFTKVLRSLGHDVTIVAEKV